MIQKNAKPVIDGPIDWNTWLNVSHWSSRGNTPTSVDLLICKQIGKNDTFF